MKLHLILMAPLFWISCGLPEPGPPPRPEHPRPQLERADWLNLNGYWGFGFGAADEESPWFGDSIRVPFPWQSDAAEVEEMSGTVGWYRRSFTAPTEWRSRQMWLHLDGVEGKATIWIDGAEVGDAGGGFTAAEFDATELIEPGVDSEITVRVVSDSGAAQSGLVGTVWLESRPRTHLSHVEFRTMREADSWAVEARLTVVGPGGAADVVTESSDAAVSATRTSVVLAGGSGETVVRIPITDGEPWSPDSPRLYPLTIRVVGVGDETDLVQTSFGLRTVEREGRRVLVNGAPTYFRGVARSPELPTAVDDGTLRHEVERLKTMGFNLLHVAPGSAEPRLHYWADRLGVWILEEDGVVAGPSSLVANEEARPLELEIADTGSDQGSRPLLISLGPQDSANLPQLFRDFTNRAQRLDFSQGYIWSAEIPSSFGYEALVPDMTVADLQSEDYVGLDGVASFEANLGDKLTIAPFVSRYSSGDEQLRLQVWLRAMNDLGGEIEIFSRPRVVHASPGEVLALEEIEMSVPLSRGLSGAIGFELLNDAGERRAANYAPLIVRGFDTPQSPRAEQFAPRRLALRAAPGEGLEVRESDGTESIEYVYSLAPEEIAAGPTAVEVLTEIATYPPGEDGSLVRVLLNGREIGELNIPGGPTGPAAVVATGSGSRYGYLAKLRVDLTAEDIVALRQRRELSLEFVPVRGGFAVFGERSGRYVIDPTVILVTENVPGSAN